LTHPRFETRELTQFLALVTGGLGLKALRTDGQSFPEVCRGRDSKPTEELVQSNSKERHYECKKAEVGISSRCGCSCAGCTGVFGIFARSEDP
jgi:hypothetical protein